MNLFLIGRKAQECMSLEKSHRQKSIEATSITFVDLHQRIDVSVVLRFRTHAAPTYLGFSAHTFYHFIKK